MDEELKVDNPEEENDFSPEAGFTGPETNKCKFCGRELSVGFDFCTYCGKSQKDVPAIKPEPEKIPEKTIPVKKAHRKFDSPVLFAFATVFFVLAALTFIIALINLSQVGAVKSGNNPFGGLFSSDDNSELIKSMINITANLLTSILFTVTGFFLMILRKLK